MQYLSYKMAKLQWILGAHKLDLTSAIAGIQAAGYSASSGKVFASSGFMRPLATLQKSFA